MEDFQFNDKSLKPQPFHDTIRKFDTLCRSKGIQQPYTQQGFESVLQINTLRDELVKGFSAGFRGEESYQKAYESCVNHTFAEHSNPFTNYFDVNGNAMGLEGYGPTAITGQYQVWTRMAPMLTAGYFARARSLEFYQIYHDDKPTFFRTYSVMYVQKGLSGKRMNLPKAIRSGAISGMFDLPEIVMNKDDEAGNIEECGAAGSKINMIKVGTTGNLFEQGTINDGTPVDKFKHALERTAMIDYIHVKFKKGGEGTDNAEEIDQNVRVRIERGYKEGKTSEVFFNRIVSIPYTRKTSGDASTEEVTKVTRVMAILDLDTGNYQIMSDSEGVVTHVHFKVRVTNVANEMETVMNGKDTYTMSFDVENKIYGSIPVIPEMTQDFNTAGEGISYISHMTDIFTDTYAGIRDNDLEKHIDDSYDYGVSEFELFNKLGGYKYSATYPIIPRHPGGSDDILAPQRIAIKHYMTRIFTRAEKFMNFDREIERQWIVMANDESLDILPDVVWTTNSATLDGNSGQNIRFDFSVDDAYGWCDSFGRRVRVIGSRDERWLSRPIWMVLKSLNMAAPTTIYFPYMFRAFSSISADLRNRPAIMFASRDAKRVSTMVQARISLEGNDLSLYANASAFAAGLSSEFTPLYNDEDGKIDNGNMSEVIVDNIPNIIPDTPEQA